MAEQKEFPSDKADKFVVRFPEGMRDRIKAAAEASGRSMNAEIVSRLEESLDAKEFVGPDGKRILSAIQRLEEMLSITEGQLASSKQSMLIVSHALAVTYPAIAPMLEDSPKLRKIVEPSITAAMHTIEKFLPDYEPVGLELAQRALATAQKLFPDMGENSLSSKEMKNTDAQIKAFENKILQDIKVVVDDFAVSNAPQKK